MNPWHAFGMTVIMQLTAITLIAAVLMLCARGRSSTRHAIGVVSLFLILGSPIAVPLLPSTTAWNEVGRPDTSRPESADSSAEDQPRLRLTEPPPTVLPQPARPANDRETIAEMVRLDLPTAQPSEGFAADKRALTATLLNVMGCVWGVGVIGFGGRLLISRHRLNWIWKSLRSAAIPDEILNDVREAVGKQQLPPIVTSDVAPMPLVLGVSRPTVVLPTGLLTSTSADRLRDVLIHECAHVVRHDPWIHMLQQFAGLLYWPHPGVHWLNRHIAQAREEVCDNYVLQHGDATEYSQTLLEVAERFTDRHPALSLLGLFTRRWTLEQRVSDLLNPGRKVMTRTPFATVIATTLILVAGSAWVGGIGAISLAAEQTSPPNAAANSGQGQQSPERSKKVENSAAGTANDPPAVAQPGAPSDQPIADLAPSESDAEAFAATLRLYKLHNFRQAISDPQLLPQLENTGSLGLAGTQITDSDLRHLERLTKLEKLAMTDTLVEGRGLTHLKGLSWLTSLKLIGPQATDEWLRSMPELPNLKTLELRGSRVTDAGMQNLKKFPNLKFLSLANTEIGDEGLKVLQYLPKVFHLDLADTNVSDRGLAYLKHTPWLVTLSLGSPNIQGFGTKHLLDLPNLDRVKFIGHGVTDQWMHPIEPLRSMYWLELHRTNVTAAGIAAISEWTELKHLYLNRNSLLTDDVVEHLKGLRELDVLELHRTGVMPGGVSTLRQALPDTSVRYQLEE